jgi:DNA-binding NarL/FixJ family response regulator
VKTRKWNITNREIEILHLIADEYPNKDIAKELDISIGTVEVHRRNLFLKTGASNMAGLIHRAYQNGILTIGPKGSLSKSAHTKVPL